MHPELIVLSGHIALLVLLASLLASLITWLMCKGQSAPPALPLEQEKEQFGELKQQLSQAEAACMTALEQRDEAERQAISHRASLRDAEQHSDKLQADLQAHQRVVADSEVALARLRNELKVAMDQLTDTRTELDAQRSTASLAERDLTEARAEVERHRADALRLEADLATAQQAAAEAASRLILTEKNVTALRGEAAARVSAAPPVVAPMETSPAEDFDFTAIPAAPALATLREVPKKKRATKKAAQA